MEGKWNGRQTKGMIERSKEKLVDLSSARKIVVVFFALIIVGDHRLIRIIACIKITNGRIGSNGALIVQHSRARK